MRELAADPREVTVAEHYDPDGRGLVFAVVNGPFVVPAPAGYEGADSLILERGDRPDPEQVSVAEFADADLTICTNAGVAKYGMNLDSLSRDGKREVLTGDTNAGSDVFDAAEYDGDAGVDASARNADGTFAEGD